MSQNQKGRRKLTVGQKLSIAGRLLRGDNCKSISDAMNLNLNTIYIFRSRYKKGKISFRRGGCPPGPYPDHERCQATKSDGCRCEALRMKQSSFCVHHRDLEGGSGYRMPKGHYDEERGTTPMWRDLVGRSPLPLTDQEEEDFEESLKSRKASS